MLLSLSTAQNKDVVVGGRMLVCLLVIYTAAITIIVAATAISFSITIAEIKTSGEPSWKRHGPGDMVWWAYLVRLWRR